MGHLLWKMNCCVLAFFYTTAVSLWTLVGCQCSEAHRTACSLPLLQLNQLSHLLYPPDRYVPDYNETTLTTVCRLYDSYIHCSRPYLEDCNHDTLTEMHFLASVFRPLCGDFMKDYLGHRDCFKKLDNSYDSCQRSRQKHLDSTTSSSRNYGPVLCDATNEYVLCLFTATSLGCSIDAAKVYTGIVNQTLVTLLSNSGYSCRIANPTDVIQLLTTTTSTTSSSTTIPTNARGPHGPLTTTVADAYATRDAGTNISAGQNILIVLLVIQYGIKYYFTVTRT